MAKERGGQNLGPAQRTPMSPGRRRRGEGSRAAEKAALKTSCVSSSPRGCPRTQSRTSSLGPRPALIPSHRGRWTETKQMQLAITPPVCSFLRLPLL